MGSIDDGCIRWGGNRRMGRGSFLWVVNLGRAVVTNGDFVAYLCESDALFPNYFGGRLVRELNGDVAQPNC